MFVSFGFLFEMQFKPHTHALEINQDPTHLVLVTELNTSFFLGVGRREIQAHVASAEELVDAKSSALCANTFLLL